MLLNVYKWTNKIITVTPLRSESAFIYNHLIHCIEHFAVLFFLCLFFSSLSLVSAWSVDSALCFSGLLLYSYYCSYYLPRLTIRILAISQIYMYIYLLDNHSLLFVFYFMRSTDRLLSHTNLNKYYNQPTILRVELFFLEGCLTSKRPLFSNIFIFN